MVEPNLNLKGMVACTFQFKGQWLYVPQFNVKGVVAPHFNLKKNGCTYQIQC